MYIHKMPHRSHTSTKKRRKPKTKRESKRRGREKKSRINPSIVMKSIDGIEGTLLMVAGRRRKVNRTKRRTKSKLRGGKGSCAQQASVIGHRQPPFSVFYLNRRSPP